MSSKLHRGGAVGAEPVTWRRVPSLDALPEGGGVFPSAGYAPTPSGPVTHAGSALEQHLQGAYQQGFQDGQSAVQQELGGQLDAMASRLARTIEELSGLRQRYRHEAEEDVIALAMAIARRILHRELTVDPEALLGLVKAALAKLEVSEVHRARVSSEDAPLVQPHLDKMGLPQRVELIADSSLERGSAILDSSRGALDVSVETQLAEIERGFADLVRRA
ncbi:MAG TPA: FliH/SctL family protein [Bryobacteraceae bacterium]|nr:FliH/SctL family protein [Bryobacteraceae bacterium]